MKSKLLILATLAALLFFAISCSTDKHESFLTADQHALLDVPKTGRFLTFNENGQLFTIEIGILDIGTYQQEFLKGGLITPSTTYKGEYGKLFYNFPDGSHKLYLNLTSENLYLNTGKTRQFISVYTNTGKTSIFEIDFKNKMLSKELGGLTYTDVVLGIDSDKSDTLYWKKELGVLGWKKSNENYTVYRVK